MNNTAARFSSLLEKQGFPMAIIKVEDRGEKDTVFAFGQLIKNNQVNIVIDFDEESTCIDFNIFSLAKLKPETNRIKVFELLNRYNSSFRFPKFYIDKEDEVVAQITIPYEKEVSEEMMFDMLRSMLSFCHKVSDEISDTLE
ncbi:YbjN domain-containing protein [Haloimpatiens sp. FM7315]|uniref:YbjN domain-containing protein n=1 Tax=Haloimpatiens sp. FM7315 TaxID=3298609 RepID=UPI0035A33A24